MGFKADFWDWAVHAYAGEGVAEACLILQDEDDQNVPLLLWAAWLAVSGIAVDSLANEGAVLARQWSDTVIVPLRLMRRRLKSGVSASDGAVRLPLREKIKSAELESERALMLLLAQLAASGKSEKSEPEQSISDLMLYNIGSASVAWGEKAADQNIAALSQALSEGQILRYDA